MPASPTYDLIIIGGGINGIGIARDAAGRGLSVLVCDKGDLGGATSSASTKLIHGGLRYLEQYEFRLVREALLEREALLSAAPHIIWPLRFILPHTRHMRPFWLIRLGLFLYDHLGIRKHLPSSARLNLHKHEVGTALKDIYKTAFAYYDCWVQDNRLVILNARDAKAKGAEVRPRTTVVAAERRQNIWHVSIEGPDGRLNVTGKSLINAAGPWVGQVAQTVTGRNSSVPVRLVKGSHIVTRRLFAHDSAYLFQNSDGRVIFAIPYERDFTLIGTTDINFDADLDRPEISAAEIDYLCRAVSAYLKHPIGSEDILWSYAGVRPLHGAEGDDASAVSRDYRFELDQPADGAPLLTIYGGKLTTYRRLAEQAVNRICRALDIKTQGTWTHGAVLPGGDLPSGDFDCALTALMDAKPWLPKEFAWRLLRNYGSEAKEILGPAGNLSDLGQCFGADLYEAELSYVIKREWVRHGEDYLWRRSKMGLRLTQEERTAVCVWVGAQIE